VLDTALGARRQPLTFSITTAGTYDPESIGWQTHDYATKVLDGTFEDDQFFAYIAAADLEDDWRDPATWAKANPNMGVSLKPDYIERQCAKAEKQNSFTNEFLRLHLNRWTAQVTRWLSPEAWAANDSKPIDEVALVGRLCYAGVDLATKHDLTTLVLWFPEPDGTATLLCRAWLPKESAKREADKGRRHYQTWADQGWITLTDGEYVHMDVVEKEILALSEKFRIQEMGFDPWNATTFATHMQESGLTMVEIRQGPKSMSEATKDFEMFVNTKRLHHGGNPVLRWAVSNAVIRSDVNGNVAPDRKSSIDKIDPVVASIMALSRANGRAEDAYSGDRGFLTL
jgi:phage terminase large subunit-like protein